jgi:hypothetical protein
MSNRHVSRLHTCIYCGKKFEKGRQVLGHVVGKHVNTTRLRSTTIAVKHLTDLQIGYLAAFLDGEGGIQITRSKRKNRKYIITSSSGLFYKLKSRSYRNTEGMVACRSNHSLTTTRRPQNDACSAHHWNQEHHQPSNIAGTSSDS